MSEEKDSLTIPSDVLARISEHTAGGFMLFFMGAEGDPEFVFQADNGIIKRGLVSYAIDLLENIKDAEKFEYAGHFQDPDDDEED